MCERGKWGKDNARHVDGVGLPRRWEHGRSVHRIETQAPGIVPEAGAVITMTIAPGYSRDTVAQAVQFLWGAVMNDDARFGEIRGE